MNVYKMITDNIVRQLEAGNLPAWRKGWKANNQPPCNPVTGTVYKGINNIILRCSGHTSAHWLTFKQVNQLGAKVQKGQHSTPIVFWQFIDKTDENGNKKKIPLLRYYNVFNIDQIDGIDTGYPDDLGEIEKTPISELITSNNAALFHDSDQAFFSPSKDEIHMPHPKQFDSVAEYDSTLAHELVHWTGHKSRLARDMSGVFGQPSYAFEELIAELGSVFLTDKTGGELVEINHVSYLDSWLQKLKSDSKYIFKAAKAAELAVDYLLGEPSEQY